MPCRSDYMEQNNSEARFQRTAKLLVWLNDRLSLSTPRKFQTEADNYYAKNVGQVEALCKTIRDHSKKFEIILAANLRHDTTARDLADWWDEHQAEDRKREAAERKRASDKSFYDAVMARYTPAEREIIRRGVNGGFN